MGPTRSKIKKTRKSIMKPTKGESRNYTYLAVLGICIACLPWLVAASQLDERHHVGASDLKVDLDGDLELSESQNIGVVQRTQQRMQHRAQQQRAHPQAAATAPIAVPTSPVPVAVAPPPSSPPPLPAAAPPATFTLPKTDLAGAPSYAPRYVVPPVNPWRERLPYEVQQFRRRATDDDGNVPEDDYQPQESKGKKHSPSVFKRVRNGIRNTGKAIVGAPSYILKRYRGTWKKYFGGGGKKKKGGWKAWSPGTDKNDGWGGWEEVEPTGGYYEEPSHYPSDKGWKSSKGYSKGYSYDSHERRSDRDRESTSYRDYRDRDSKDNRDYDAPPSRPARYRSERGDRPKYNTSYREETHYDDYDGRRTTAYYGPSSKKSPSKRPSSSSGSSYRYDDDY